VWDILKKQAIYFPTSVSWEMWLAIVTMTVTEIVTVTVTVTEAVTTDFTCLSDNEGHVSALH
jgi:hypothetical protein